MIVSKNETMDDLIDNLGDLFVYVKVVDLKSFSAAARALGSTKSAVSKQVRRLENALGTRLLNRTTRHLGLTETGQLVYLHGLRIGEETAALRSSVDGLQDKPRGTLRVATSVAFGNMHVTGLIGEFLAQYPEISVSLTLSDRYVDLVDEGIDVAIRLTSKPMDSVVARRLADINYVVCASPAYLLRNAAIATPFDLAAHACLVNGYAPDAPWRFVRDGHPGQLGQPGQLSEIIEVAVQGRLSVNSSESLRVAVLDGVGPALLPTYAVAADIKAGRLAVVLPEYRVEGSFGNSIYAIFLPSKFTAPKMRVFIDFLLAKFVAGAPWDSN